MKDRAPLWIYILFACVLSSCHTKALVPSPTGLPTVTVAASATSAPTTAPAATATKQTTPSPVEFVWKLAGDPNPFNAPVGIAVDSQLNIYVMDTKNLRVQKFDRDGEFLLMWGSSGSGEGQFAINLPDEGRLAVDSQGNVYVCDLSNFRIQKFDSSGNYLAQWGSKGNGDGQFSELAEIAIDQQDQIYAADYANRTVQKFDANGKLLLRWGPDSIVSQIYTVATDPDGNVLIGEQGGRIQKFDPNGQLIFSLLPQTLDNITIEPWNIAVDDHGIIYIADYNGFRVVMLDSQGNILTSWRGKSSGGEMFTNLEDVAVDAQGNVYVSDSTGNLVQKFRQPAYRP